jgi:magnesium transporter
MASSLRKRRRRRRFKESKISQPPGTMIYVGDETKEQRAGLSLLTIGRELTLDEAPGDESLRLAAQGGAQDDETVYWLQVRGLNDIQEVNRIGKIFNLHPLALEDIVDTSQRSKWEDHGRYLFFVFKAPLLDRAGSERSLEQISLVLGSNYVITFQDQPGELADFVRQRLQNSADYRRQGQLCTAASLFYDLMDIVVDFYYLYYDALHDGYDSLEEKILLDPSHGLLQDIISAKHESVALLKALRPLKEIIARLERRQEIFQNIDLYMRDLYDHLAQLTEAAEGLRDLMFAAMDIYLGSINNRTNMAMKFLTIFAALFMPLTFLTGLYGMNFEYMPELAMEWAYPALLLLMVFIVIGMLVFFRFRKWL